MEKVSDNINEKRGVQRGGGKGREEVILFFVDTSRIQEQMSQNHHRYFKLGSQRTQQIKHQ